MGVKTVAGGPLFTAGYQEYEDVDYFVLNEAEITLPPFLEDLKKGCAKHRYSSKELPDIATTPTPLWGLIARKKYATMSIQYSRGCPFHCEFCNIPALYGHKVRTKSKAQIINEIEALYSLGWRGDVFLVDDNFIGNRGKLKRDILPAMSAWMEEKQHPFTFNTEASIDLSDDEELMQLMVKAGFASVPQMDYELLIKGYKDILGRIYSPATYYTRVREFLRDYRPLQRKAFHFHFSYLGAFFKSMPFLGIIGKERFYYWRLFFWSLFRRPQLFHLALTFSIYGYHFRKIFEECL